MWSLGSSSLLSWAQLFSICPLPADTHRTSPISSRLCHTRKEFSCDTWLRRTSDWRTSYSRSFGVQSGKLLSTAGWDRRTKVLARDKGSTSVPGVVLGVLAEHDRWLAQNKWRKPIPIVANVISLVAKGLSGGDAGQSHPGRVCSPDKP